MTESDGSTARIRRPAPEAAGSDAPDAASGRARFDSRGNTVWEWKTESGEYSSEVSTVRVKKLQESADLTLEKTAIAEKPTLPPTFNPYDNVASVEVKPPVNPPKAAVKPLRPKPVILPARKPVGFLARLKAAITGR
jgi:hypothetical protein